MKNRAATVIRNGPETAIPAYLFKSHAVSGQAAIPDNSANQPFVSGSGPFVHKSHNPPPPATIVQAQAAIQPSLMPSLPEFCLSVASVLRTTENPASKIALASHLLPSGFPPGLLETLKLKP